MDEGRDWFDDLKAVRGVNADPETKHLLLVLMTFVRQDSCWPSISTLMQCLGLSRDATKARLRKAIAEGWIESEKRFDGAKQLPNRLRIVMSKVSDHKPEPPEEDEPAPVHPALQVAQPEKPKRKRTPCVIQWTAEQQWTGITDRDMEVWRSAYPACDIPRQLQKMTAWLLANPNQTKTQWGRFIVNWLTFAQNRGGDRDGIPTLDRTPRRPYPERSGPPSSNEPIRGPKPIGGAVRDDPAEEGLFPASR